MRMRGAAVAALVLVTAPIQAAEADGRLKACAAVPDPTARLACYDALQPPLAPAIAPLAPAPAPAPALPAPVASAATDADFGAESLGRGAAKADEPKPLQARLAQEFSGWEKGTRFVLDNGQVWQATGGDVAYYKQAPAGLPVTIEKRWSGGYEMAVEGYSRKFKVRRVR